MDVKLSKDWTRVMKTELEKPYFKNLIKKISNRQKEAIVHPPSPVIFKAFDICDFSQLSVVILGQDPYHGADQATGLSFSVPKTTKLPPSLRNIYKELTADIGVTRANGSLEDWATQGVLLLNATLTVEASKPASHQGLGWETFTDMIIKKVSEEKENIVFILWGKYAEAKIDLIDSKRHLVLTSSHPSPFSAHRGFFGSRPFSKANTYLKEHGKKPIIW